MILVAGGDADPNILHLVRRLADRRTSYRPLIVGASSFPRLTWRLDDDRLWIDGVEARPTALFLRYDVFTHLRDRRPESQRRAARWYHALLSWALAHPEVAFLNRDYGARQTSKPHALHLARQLGLATPETLVTNDPDMPGDDAAAWIAKPVNGGDYTRLLADARADGAWAAGMEPAIVQRRLVGPELRIYRVGDRWFAFRLDSEALDYRATRDVAIGLVPAPEDLTGPLRRLMDRLGLDFGAADFKTCPETGRPLFLEVNSAPMFVAFDRAAAGALCDAIIDWLAAGQSGSLHG